MSAIGVLYPAAGAAIGTLGVIIGGIVLAGLSLKFSAVLVDLSGGNLLLALVLVTIISIITGMAPARPAPTSFCPS